jgi:DNA-binding MarR family transcriptional regulator
VVTVVYMQYMARAILERESHRRRPGKLPADRVLPVLPLDRAPCACTVIRRAARKATQLYDDALAPAGLRITQYSLLANLDRHGAIAMTKLAELLGMDRTTLTRNVGPLERDGLIVLRSTGHGRTKLVTLTESGRRRLRAAFPYWLQAQERFDRALGTEPAGDLARLANAIAPLADSSTPRP